MAGAGSGVAAKKNERRVDVDLEGCWVQQRFSTLVGRRKVNVKFVAWRKAHKEIQRISESGRKKPKLKRKSGSGIEASSRTLLVKAHGTGVTSVWKSRSLRSTKAGACQQRASRVTLQQTALFWVQLECGEHVAGQWYSWTNLHGMHGSMAAELEVQRTIKRAELTAFLCALKK